MTKHVNDFERPISLCSEFVRGVCGFEISGIQPHLFPFLVCHECGILDHHHLTVEDSIVCPFSNGSKLFLPYSNRSFSPNWRKVGPWWCATVLHLWSIGRGATILPSRSVVHCKGSLDKFLRSDWSFLIVRLFEGGTLLRLSFICVPRVDLLYRSTLMC